MYRLEERAGGVGERYGELAHHVLERWDYRDPSRLPALVDELARRDFPDHLKDRLKESLGRFADSDLRRMIGDADEIRREERFAFLEDDVLIRGTMDLVARTGNACVIVDFKTNAVAPEEVAEAAVRYRLQLGLYALALSRAEDIIPGRIVIHFLAPGVSHETPCDSARLDEVSRTLGRILESMEAGDFRANRTDRCGECPYDFLCSGGRPSPHDPG
jgi:RecB family exonuclease